MRRHCHDPLKARGTLAAPAAADGRVGGPRIQGVDVHDVTWSVVFASSGASSGPAPRPLRAAGISRVYEESRGVRIGSFCRRGKSCRGGVDVRAGGGPGTGPVIDVGGWQAACARARYASCMSERAMGRSIDKKNLRFFRSEEHTSELQSLMRISYSVFCLK